MTPMRILSRSGDIMRKYLAKAGLMESAEKKQLRKTIEDKAVYNQGIKRRLFMGGAYEEP